MVQRLFILVAVICAVAALIAVVFDVSDPKLYPAAIAASLMFGFAAHYGP